MLAELAAAEIAKIAFEAVIGKLTEGAMDKGVELWQKIKQKLQKEPTAAKVLAAAEQTKSEAMIEQQVVPFLDFIITRLLGRFAPIFYLNCEHVLFVYILKQRRKKFCGFKKKIRKFSRI